MEAKDRALLEQIPVVVFMACGVADGAAFALRAMGKAKADVLVLDISLEGPDGLEFLKTLRGKEPDPPVLILSMHDELIYPERAMRAGANGYIMKQEATEA